MGNPSNPNHTDPSDPIEPEEDVDDNAIDAAILSTYESMCSTLQMYVGETGESEGALDVLNRLLRELEGYRSAKRIKEAEEEAAETKEDPRNFRSRIQVGKTIVYEKDKELFSGEVIARSGPSITVRDFIDNRSETIAIDTVRSIRVGG